MKKIRWHIGCSGFSYKEWKEEFYPKGLAQSKWFSYYTEHFNTLELNVTFYRFPTLKSLQSWYDKAPDGFSFSAKVPRPITHYKKFVGTEGMMNDFYGTLREGLKEKLSCVLFQLPPSFTYSSERLESVIQHTDKSFQNVIEFRHESWWREDVRQILSKHQISFCGVSFPKISFDEAVVNIPVCYYRFHGVPVLFYSEYDEAFIENIYRQILTSENTEEAFIYFNNTASLAALHNAKYLQRLVSAEVS
ncbi:MAG TPA: DUF72 domain-containing protein [Flavisolibacter sp.]|jgi:uncharacterized protein YecE (DUF72 family)